ncbi:MAG: PKD domain-containing protein, partial [Fidelibacterota bacterium]
MKKLNYIIAFTMVGLIGFQPVKQNITNYLSKQNRLTQEAFINDFLSKRQTVSYKDSKKLPKALRPDLKGAHDYLMMYDPSTGTIPTERILDAVEFAEQKRMSLSYEKRMTEVNWVERGPNTIGGRTRAILLDPNDSTNKKLWAAGVTGGLWYTNDITSGNPTWNSVDGTWGNLAVGSINSDPNDSNTMYVGTGERMGIFSTSSRGLGMWKTTDGGATWSHLTATENFNYVTDIVVRNESGTSVVYAGVGGHYYEGKWHGSANTGLWRSADGGATWTQVMDTASTDGDAYEIMDLDMGSDNRIWAASRTNVYGNGGGDIFYSDDGTNWTKASLGFIGSANRTIVAVAPSDPNTVYGMIASSDTRKINWIVKTTDSGANWTVYTYGGSDPFPVDSNGNVLGDANGQAGYDLSLGVDPNDPNTVFAGELDIFKTTDAGASWTQVTGGGSGTASMHVDQQNLKTITSNEVIFSNDGGIYYTSDAGVTVSNRNTGYNVSQFYSVALHPDAGSQYVMGGTQDNGTWTIQGTGIQSGSYEVGGDGGYTHIDQIDPNYQFTATTYNSIYRSTNGGSSFSLYANHEAADGSDTGFFINPSTIDPTSQTFYSAVDASTILRLNNYSTLADKTLMSISLGSTASAFKMSPHTDGVLFVGTSAGRVFKITDAHTASYTATDISGSNVNGYIASIDIGKDDNQILVTVSNYGVPSVWETVGGGGANGWIDIEGDLADMPIRWGLYNPNNYNQVILATELGTWVSDDVSISSPTWNPSNDGLANVRTDMLVKRASDNSLAAGTHGRGLFYSTGFTSTAPLSAAYTPDKTSGVFPLTVQFTDRSTGAPTSWAWDFGDGSSSAEQSPLHIYTSAGQYNVGLTVSDGSNSDVVT